jgi:SAM-dependent methyltransferase
MISPIEKLTSKLQLFKKRPDLISNFFIELIWSLIEVILKPARVICTVCGWTGWKFRTYAEENSIRKNVLCHRCKTGSRQRALVRYLSKNNKLRPNKKCLDFGKRLEYDKIFRANKCSLYYVDIVALHVDAVMDIICLGLKDNSIDLIICHHVLEHVYNDQMALRELNRILNQNGELILQVPWNPERKTTIEYNRPTSNPNDHVRDYGLDIIFRLEETGFKVKLRNDSEGLTLNEIEKYGIHNAISFICRKV